MPSSLESENMLLHHKNAPFLRVFLIQKYLIKNSFTVLAQCPYSPDQFPAENYSEKLKGLLKGHRLQLAQKVKELTLELITVEGLTQILPAVIVTGRNYSI